MKAKALTLGLICLFVFAYCKKQLPTSPKLPELGIQTPLIDFTVDRSEILYGNLTQLRWSIQNVTRAEMSIVNLETSVSQNLGEIGPQGDMEITPKARTAYTISAWNHDKSAWKSVEINVRSGANLQKIGSENITFEITEDIPPKYKFKWDISLKNIGNLATIKIRIDVTFTNYVSPGAIYHFYFYDPLMPNEQQYFEGNRSISDYLYEWYITISKWVDVTWEPI